MTTIIYNNSRESVNEPGRATFLESKTNRCNTLYVLHLFVIKYEKM